MTALRWLAGGDWATAVRTGTAVDAGALVLDATGPASGRSGPATGSYRRQGFAVLLAGLPAPAQVNTTSADRWRQVQLRPAEPVPAQCWVRLWTLVAAAATMPGPPGSGNADDDRGPVPAPADRWRAAARNALTARVLCPADGPLWVAVELGGDGTATPRIGDLRVETGDDGPVTLLPVVYRRTGGLTGTDPAADSAADPAAVVAGSVAADLGDGPLGRFTGLLADQLGQVDAVLSELPSLLDPAAAPDRADTPWLTRLATWVALDPARLPASPARRREAVAQAVQRHGRRGTRQGLRDEIRRTTGLQVEIVEPLAGAHVWRLGGTAASSALGLTTELVRADPGPPTLDRSARLDQAMLVTAEERGLPVHARLAHRICVHVPDGTSDQVAAVDEVVQRERPAHVLARTCAVSRVTRVPTVVGIDAVPGPGPAGLANDTAYDVHVDGPGVRLGTARLPADDLGRPHRTSPPTTDASRGELR